MALLRSLVFAGLLLSVHTLRAQEPIDASKGRPDPKEAIIWFDARMLTIEGQGWKETKAPFDRFPATAEGKIPPPVWNLSRNSAGINVRFVSDAKTLHFRWSLTSAKLDMPHMPATGVSGIDIYVRSLKDGRWQWVSTGIPRQQNDNRHSIAMTGEPREYLVYCPLYNGLASLEVGVPKEAIVRTAPPRPAVHAKPLLFYGTSITQGGCASRPGMVHTAILGRRFDRPVLNFGFSGNGKMDAQVGSYLAELDPAIFVIDCLPNMDAAQVQERTAQLVGILRKARPNTPILLVEDRTYANAVHFEAQRKRNESSRAALRKEYERLIDAKTPHLHYLRGDALIGDDGEGTVDGSHPTDLGFQRQADVMAEAIAPLLPQPAKRLSAVEGYTDRISYRPGETIHFHVSCDLPTFDLELTRVGAERTSVLKKQNLPGKAYSIPADASSRGCAWPVSLSLEAGKDWKSGYYEVRFSTKYPDGKVAESKGFFILRAATPGKESKILLQLATNTYNAYCNWGGYSLYAYNGRFKIQGRRVSFDRPLAGQFTNWELPFIQWAERNGYTLEYAANSDLEFHPELLAGYKLVLSVGHDEYWSAPMRDHLEKFIRNGGNVAFFSGNTCCWQVRSEDGGRSLTCWKQAFRHDPFFEQGKHALLSTLWSHHLVKRPENQLTGVGFLWGGYHKSHGQFMDGKAEYTVHRPDHWIFEGTGLKRGDTFGGKDTIVGYECDGCELAWKDGLPTPTYQDGTPDGFVVLGTAPARWHPDDCEWYERWEKGRTGNAVLGTYSRGGTVVTVGSTDWSHGLRGNDPTVVRITRNVLDRLSK